MTDQPIDGIPGMTQMDISPAGLRRCFHCTSAEGEAYHRTGCSCPNEGKEWTSEQLQAKVEYYEGKGEPTLFDVVILATTGNDAPAHRFNDEGVCIRCGQPAENWGVGCVETTVMELATMRVAMEAIHRHIEKYHDLTSDDWKIVEAIFQPERVTVDELDNPNSPQYDPNALDFRVLGPLMEDFVEEEEEEEEEDEGHE